MLDRSPMVAVIAYVELNAVAIRVGVIKSNLRPFIRSKHGLDQERFEPRVRPQELVECSVFKCHVLQAAVARTFWVGTQSRNFDDCQSVVHFIVAEPRCLNRRAAVCSTHWMVGMEYEAHPQDNLIPFEHRLQAARG